MISAVEIGSPSDEDLDLVPGLVLHSVNSMPCANGAKGVLKHLRTEIWSTLEFGSPLALEFVEPYLIITESVHRAPRPFAPSPRALRPAPRAPRPSPFAPSPLVSLMSPLFCSSCFCGCSSAVRLVAVAL